MKTLTDQSLIEKINKLRQQRNAVIVAHNYQLGEVQDIADFVGDSLAMGNFAEETEANVILVCGVHFMAESAAIMNPKKTVLIPDLQAGCSLAECISAEQLQEWKKNHPEAIIVAYVNTSAEVKALSDLSCTSTNAVKVIQSLPQDKEILFIPDMYLGHWVRTKCPNHKIHLWNGSCHTHVRIKPEPILQLKKDHPQSKLLMHPECGCLTACMNIADEILSTDGIIRHVKKSNDEEFIIATEVGIIHRLSKENPQKKFYPAATEASCEFMKKITLEKILWSLQDLQFRVTVREEIAAKARKSLSRMKECL